MQPTHDEPFAVQLIDETTTVSLGQLCRSCGVHAEWITVLVDHGVLEPARGDRRASWEFAATQLPRVHTARRLQRDLGLNSAGLALALELLEENQALRRRLEALGEI